MREPGKARAATGVVTNLARVLRSAVLLWPLAGCIGQQPTTALPDHCSLPAESGPCTAAFPRWAFDPARGTCAQFTWGGCGGNANNFESEEACLASCQPQTPATCGGWSPHTCANDEFCDFAQDGCDYADASGVCVARPEAWIS